MKDWDIVMICLPGGAAKMPRTRERGGRLDEVKVEVEELQLPTPTSISGDNKRIHKICNFSREFTSMRDYGQFPLNPCENERLGHCDDLPAGRGRQDAPPTWCGTSGTCFGVRGDQLLLLLARPNTCLYHQSPPPCHAMKSEKLQPASNAWEKRERGW